MPTTVSFEDLQKNTESIVVYDENPATLSEIKADLSYSAAAKNRLLPDS